MGMAAELESQKKVLVDDEEFFLVLERRRGVAIYANKPKTKYLRIGTPELVGKELNFHKELLSLGFPVARILAEGEQDEAMYWIEESLGEYHMGTIFKEETRATGSISAATFGTLLAVVQQVHDVQERHIGGSVDMELLAGGIHYERLIAEMPDDEETMRAAWKKLTQDFVNYPSCLTHGDLTSHNVMPGGVIDFGDHFVGPLGFDIINCITTPFWFPNDPEKNEFGHRTYSFTGKQIEEYFARVGMFTTPNGILDLKQHFDPIFILKAWWWTVANHPMPKLQVWRYDVFRTLLRRYLAGESLYDYWIQHKDD